MKFCEAMDALIEGRKVTRTPWKNSLYFIMKDNTVMSYQPSVIHYTYNENIMVSDDWIVDELQTNEPMQFCEIIPYLNNGSRAWMEDWEDSFIYLDKSSGQLILHTMSVFPFTPTFADFIAEDWEII